MDDRVISEFDPGPPGRRTDAELLAELEAELAQGERELDAGLGIDADEFLADLRRYIEERATAQRPGGPRSGGQST